MLPSIIFVNCMDCKMIYRSRGGAGALTACSNILIFSPGSFTWTSLSAPVVSWPAALEFCLSSGWWNTTVTSVTSSWDPSSSPRTRRWSRAPVPSVSRSGRLISTWSRCVRKTFLWDLGESLKKVVDLMTDLGWRETSILSNPNWIIQVVIYRPLIGLIQS